MRFWTVLQHPFHQAVYIENGKIKASIPDHPPRTISKRVGAIGEYEDKLAIARHASYGLWSKDGKVCHLSAHNQYIYTPHGIMKYGNDFLICSSGLDLFVILDIWGEAKWLWWGHKYGIGGVNPYFNSENWLLFQTTSDICGVPIEKQAHFNSIWEMNDGCILTSSLRKKEIITIKPFHDGFVMVASVLEDGLHSPIMWNNRLIYGTEKGIMTRESKIFEEFGWIKFIRPVDGGFIFTHECGVVVTDEKWNIEKTIELPKPFQIAFFER